MSYARIKAQKWHYKSDVTDLRYRIMVALNSKKTNKQKHRFVFFISAVLYLFMIHILVSCETHKLEFKTIIFHKSRFSNFFVNIGTKKKSAMIMLWNFHFHIFLYSARMLHYMSLRTSAIFIPKCMALGCKKQLFGCAGPPIIVGCSIMPQEDWQTSVTTRCVLSPPHPPPKSWVDLPILSKTDFIIETLAWAHSIALKE